MNHEKVGFFFDIVDAYISFEHVKSYLFKSPQSPIF